jgi:heptaprenylglyceryl phosphate synthase
LGEEEFEIETHLNLWILIYQHQICAPMILPISDTISCQEYDIHYVLMLSVLNSVSCKFLLGDMQGQSTKVDDIGLPGHCSAVIAYLSNLDLIQPSR